MFSEVDDFTHHLVSFNRNNNFILPGFNHFLYKSRYSPNDVDFVLPSLPPLINTSDSPVWGEE